MKDEFVNYNNLLREKVDELHSLTADTCEMCGGTYVENLNGAINYFSIDGKRFKMTVTKI
jgi:hypothetical protein